VTKKSMFPEFYQLKREFERREVDKDQLCNL